MGERFLIVGLGNPGAGYAGTRHNAGAMVVEALARAAGVELGRARGRMRVAETVLEGREVLLAVPTTFMNESGPPVARLVRRVGASPQDLLVCHDELDIPFGRLRLKAGGGTAGHRGLESICASLRSRDFLRLRVGIGRPEPGSDATEKVLSRFSPEEQEALPAVLDRALEGIRILLREGLDAAQNVLHAT